MDIIFSENQGKYITSQVLRGDFKNASDLIKDALRIHELYRNQMLDELRLEINQGWEMQTTKRTVKDVINEKIRASKP